MSNQSCIYYTLSLAHLVGVRKFTAHSDGSQCLPSNQQLDFAPNRHVSHSQHTSCSSNFCISWWHYLPDPTAFQLRSPEPIPNILIIAPNFNLLNTLVPNSFRFTHDRPTFNFHRTTCSPWFLHRKLPC